MGQIIYGPYLILLFRALLFSFLVCGALAYVLIILYDSQEIDDSIKDHVEKEFVSDGDVSKIHKLTKAGHLRTQNSGIQRPFVRFQTNFR